MVLYLVSFGFPAFVMASCTNQAVRNLQEGSELIVKLVKQQLLRDSLLVKDAISFNTLRSFLDAATQNHSIGKLILCHLCFPSDFTY